MRSTLIFSAAILVTLGACQDSGLKDPDLSGTIQDEDLPPFDRPCVLKSLKTRGDILIACEDGTRAIMPGGYSPDRRCRVAPVSTHTHRLYCDGSPLLIQGDCEDGFPIDLEFSSVDDTRLLVFRATGCDSVNGGLFIMDYDGASLPEAIQGITEIKRFLMVEGSAIEELSLPHLTRIASVEGERPGQLQIRNNPNLKTIKFSPEFSELDGGVWIESNPQLLSGPDLSKLSALRGALEIIDNPELSAMPPFSALQEMDEGLRIENNPKLSEFPDFPELIRLGGDPEDLFSFIGNEALQKLPEFPKLEFVAASLLISNNASLETLPAFPRLENLTTGVSIESNPKLVSIQGFPSLTDSGEVIIARNPKLKEIHAFQSLEIAKDGIQILDNDALETLEGSFSGLTGLGQMMPIAILDNPKLVGMADFSQLVELNGSFEVARNPLLTSLGAFTRLEKVYSGSIIIHDNAALTEMGTFPALELIAKGLELTENDALEALPSFPRLKEIRQVFKVEKNASLSSIGSFPVFQRMSEADASGKGFQVQDNPELPECEVEALYQQLEATANGPVPKAISGNQACP